MTLTTQNNNNLAIATLNRFATESIKIIEDLKKQLIQKDIDIERVASLSNKRVKEIGHLVSKCKTLKTKNEKLTQQVNQLKGQLPTKPHLKTSVNKDKEYFTAYSTQDFKAARKENFSFVEDHDPDNLLYFKIHSLYSTKKGKELGNESDLLLSTTFQDKKYMYVDINRELAEKIFLSYTKKDLVAFAMDTMNEWKTYKVLTSNKLITKDDIYIPQTSALETFNPNQLDQLCFQTDKEKVKTWPSHIETACYN